MISLKSSKFYQSVKDRILKANHNSFASEGRTQKNEINLKIVLLLNKKSKAMREDLIPFLERAFAEDIGDGDHTTLASIPAETRGKSRLIIKEAGVVAGVSVAKEVFRFFDPELKVTEYIADGSEVRPGDIVFEVEGRVHSLLQTERLMLNIMQRMSGIATTTRRYQKELEGTKTKVLDTRKTTPGMRLLEKEAVKLGGGENHRIGLYDMILLKDNHVDFAGGIENAIKRANDYLKTHNKHLKIEIEVRNLDELERVMKAGGVNRIMLDNFDLKTTREAVKRIAGKYETESSGGITFSTLRQYAECGVDYISVGALTHSVKSLDISFKAV
jgi:nicotinate-nucleotide pyrophosphorylase (carboxylating)